jgi:hypothetical protein
MLSFLVGSRRISGNEIEKFDYQPIDVQCNENNQGMVGLAQSMHLLLLLSRTCKAFPGKGRAYQGWRYIFGFGLLFLFGKKFTQLVEAGGMEQ